MAHRVLAVFLRRLFTFLAILSLLLCLATLVLWVRSYWQRDVFKHGDSTASNTDIYELVSSSGELDISADHNGSTESRVSYPLGMSASAIRSSQMNTLSTLQKQVQSKSYWFAGFGYNRWEIPSLFANHTIHLPHWFPALLFAIFPALRLRYILRTRRALHRNRAGLCLHCGYDLRATPDCCPECGQIAEPIKG
ncbi:MAG TPA: hypothetical protein VHS31_17305 [Tepidisphaeraceae bacterium]|jgi:hypothetical protein|nr:hypothetical protein [Tepidisphaeraceae bacterium]